MRKKLLLASLLVSCYSIAFAQENSNDKTYKHDIGFNTTFLLQGLVNSSSTPFTAMYKKYTGEHKAFRLGLSLRGKINNQSTSSVNTYTDDQSYGDISLALGKEFQHEITARWTWYGGGDIAPFYFFNNTTSYRDKVTTSITKFSSFGVGLRPFLGIRFNINNRLYLSAEAALQFNYGRDSDYNKYVNDGIDNVTRDSKSNVLSLNLSPASGIFLFYHF